MRYDLHQNEVVPYQALACPKIFQSLTQLLSGGRTSTPTSLQGTSIGSMYCHYLPLSFLICPHYLSKNSIGSMQAFTQSVFICQHLLDTRIESMMPSHSLQLFEGFLSQFCFIASILIMIRYDEVRRSIVKGYPAHIRCVQTFITKRYGGTLQNYFTSLDLF